MAHEKTQPDVDELARHRAHFRESLESIPVALAVGLGLIGLVWLIRLKLAWFPALSYWIVIGIGVFAVGGDIINVLLLWRRIRAGARREP
ncbi:MAG TPA: hypothetical protein VH475_22360 [Tepidisphaeraceae bacterium]|jgi:hypothetical protein